MVIGRWKTGVAQLLSITVRTPWRLASAASARTSWVSMIQLVGLSR